MTDTPTLTAEDMAREIGEELDATPFKDNADAAAVFNRVIARGLRTYADARVKEEREVCAKIAETCWIVAGDPPQIRAMIAAALRARQPAPGKGGGT